MTDVELTLHPITISQVMINFAAQYGVNQETCLLGTGITQTQLSDGETLINRSQEMRLIENLILALPTEPALGCKLGFQYNVATFGVWGFALRTSRTLKEALAVAIRYLPLSTAYCKIRAISESELFGIEFDADHIESPLRQFLLERDMATATNLLKELSLFGASYERIELKISPPSYADILEDMLDLRPVFNASRNAVFVSLKHANTPLLTYDAQWVNLMHNQCKNQLKTRQTSGTMGQVRQHILGDLGLVASLEDVASAMSMSPRSLRRKLKKEGTTFTLILDKEREFSAVQLLLNSDIKLDELAFHLGYADTASFSRAFKRWKACSPGEYRRSSPDQNN